MHDDRRLYRPDHPLTAARGAAGLSVEQLARIADFEPTVVRAIETRCHRPTLGELNALAQVLRVKIVDLRE
ncbi:helix-turn-helix transcriptional regulator [Frigidibacter sp.]|uniref:helix-turn-helix domain-containing protein n=1 Tax=Frigidibacter sp. TaxID=2586418 RepID=UPI002732D275|nr:helix-turn-helix transcriptional regulator [Frigidibacter sp.]MDP3339689.1 helix-turn-helix transcriptional regulator [Frigidibacter sp.]